MMGKVGSGKSSLLYSFLAEMCRVKGQIYIQDIDGGFAVASQEAWIQHATIRDNILFGQPFSAHKYQAIIDATSLYIDLKVS